jgi:uncharacterized protein YuzE
MDNLSVEICEYTLNNYIGYIGKQFIYIEETDTFYLILSKNKRVVTEEISKNIFADYDAAGQLVGIEILAAGSIIDFNDLSFDSLPFKKVNIVNSNIQEDVAE